jgi:predicted DCC family thiol-disulfide oxidoreductase YuxK
MKRRKVQERALSRNDDFLLYDGECPFCSAYVRMQRLRAAGVDLALLDARDEPELVGEFAREGLDINEGMILRLRGETYFGGDVLHVLALLTGPTGAFNRLLAKLFSHRKVSRLLYPALRTGRNMTLRLLGRSRMQVSASG